MLESPVRRYSNLSDKHIFIHIGVLFPPNNGESHGNANGKGHRNRVRRDL